MKIIQRSCKYAFLVDDDWFQRNVNASVVTASISKMDTVSVVLDWNWFHSSYDLFGFGTYATKTYSGWRFCQNYRYSIDNSTSLKCYCRKGYEGNPYLLDGCEGKPLIPFYCPFLVNLEWVRSTTIFIISEFTLIQTSMNVRIGYQRVLHTTYVKIFLGVLDAPFQRATQMLMSSL